MTMQSTFTTVAVRGAEVEDMSTWRQPADVNLQFYLLIGCHSGTTIIIVVNPPNRLLSHCSQRSQQEQQGINDSSSFHTRTKII
jgi:hypothetical protein